jgi:hypothetical protein
VWANASWGGIPCERSSGSAEVEDDLAGEVLGASGLHCRERGHAGGCVDDDLAVCAGLGEAQEPHVRVGLLRLGIGRGAEEVGLGAGERLFGVARPDHDLVAELGEPGRERAADHACSQNRDLHLFSVSALSNHVVKLRKARIAGG